MRSTFFTIASILICSISILHAASPDWAKPYLKLPVPEGGYIAEDDEWVALRSEVDIGTSPQGGLTRTYRQVLAPKGSKARRLTVILEYDGVVQELVAPTVWIPGAFGYKKLNLKRVGVDIPDLDADMIASGRNLFITTTEIKPNKKAILTWQVIDKEPFPGEDVILPFGPYPAAEFSIRPLALPQEASLQLMFVEPRTNSAASLLEEEFVLKRMPALRRFYDRSDRWVAIPLGALPHFFVRTGGGGEPRWRDLALKADALFQLPLDLDAERPWAATARRLTQDAPTTGEKAARLAGFVQSLTYRNVAWGVGAYRPEPPSETLRTKSADCKGKALLLHALLSEVDIPSVPILCHVGPNYRDVPVVPTILAFNHVVLAIETPGGAQLPAALTEGPGEGWVLFDPTNPLSTFGLPPPTLEGSQALWLDADAGDPFTVKTKVPGSWSVRATLDVALDGPQEAAFDLFVEGYSGFTSTLAGKKIYQEDPERFRRRCQENLRSIAPGIVVKEAQFHPPDHQTGQKARLELRGRIPTPFQEVGGQLFTLASPVSLMGLVLGVPASGFKRGFTPDDEPVELPEGWRPERCCESFTSHLSGEITLSLPAGWSIKARPEIRSIDAPWMKAQIENDPGWAVTVELRRGRFAPGSQEQRLRDLNAVASVFRQPFLVEITELDPTVPGFD